MKFSEGDQVLAKLPNSDEFVKGKVVGVKGSRYKVQVKGGGEHSVGEGDLKAPRTSRSQTRSRGRPKSKSPSRTSPSRRSPARKSPARSPPSNQARKLPVRNARQAKISLARLDLPKGDSSDTDRTEESSLRDEFEGPTQSRLRELKPITRRSIRILSNAAKAEQEAKLASLRGVDRAASLPLERKYNAKDKDRGYSVQPDEDLKKSYYEDDSDEEIQGKSKKIDQISKPQEWGGWFGALLLIFLFPIFTFLLQIACSNGHCSTKNFRIPRIKEWRAFFNPEAFLLYAGFIAFVSLISALPIGKRVDGQHTKVGTLQYRMSGIYTLILSVAGFAGATYYGYNIGDFLLKKSVPFSVAGLTYGTILAFALYIKGGRVPVSSLNIYGSTNSKIYDFWQGREVNPRFFERLDVKMIYFRTSLIGLVLINLAGLVKIYKGTSTFDLNTLPTAAILVAAFQIIYCLDILILESSFVTSFEVTHEGTGYMLSVGYLTYPYLASVPLRYILTHKVQVALYWYAIPAILFFGGYYIYRASNSQKDKFRKNPFSPSVKHLETIPTNRGKRLIAGGWWGFSRHPNYLGDIMMHAAISILAFTIYDVVPHINFIFTTIFLIHRAFRDNARCSKRYGYAWEQYCSKVKYILLKKVF